MNALIYILKREIINRIILMFRRPLWPILFIIFIGLIFFSTFNGMSDQPSPDVARAERMLTYFQAGAFLLFSFAFIINVFSSMSGGATLFSMSDVNLVFSAPLSPQKILIYGVLRQAKQSVLTTLFFLFQIPLMVTFFNLNAQGIAGFLLAWLMLLISGSLLSMVIFSLSSKSQNIRKVILGCLVSPLLLWFIGLVMYLIINGASLSIMIEYITLPLMNYVPFVGWSIGFLMAIIQGNMLSASIFALLIVLLPLVGIEYMRRSRMDYYEDVLNKTETTFLTLQAAKEGKQISGIEKVKESTIGKVGLAGKGRGASVFFWRQITELRRSMFFVFDGASLLTVLVAIVGALILRYSVNGGSFGIYRAQVFAMAGGLYLLYFLSVSGKFAMELKKTHIYMIPASRFLKLIFAILPHILKSFLEGMVSFFIVVMVVGFPLWMLVLAPVLYTAFSGVYVAVLLFAKWITGEGAPKMVQTILFLFGGGIVAGPAVAAFIIPYVLLVKTAPQFLFLPFFLASFIAVAILFGVLGLCRGALDKMES